MAIYNEILVGRFNRSLQKLFGIKGSPPVRQVAGEISPGHLLQSGTENRFLEAWGRFSYVSQPAAQAGVAAASRLRNPVGSNIIAVLERLIVVNGGAATDFPILQAQASQADLSVIAFSPATRWDPRGQPASGLIRSESQAVPAPALFAKMQIAALAGTNVDFIIDTIHELPLLPGDAVQMQSNLVNTTPVFCWLWRERFLEDSERS